MIKKFLVSAFVVLFAGAGLGLATTAFASATPATGKCDDGGTLSQRFFSFPTWYRGLPCDTGNEINLEGKDIGTDVVFPIALNIIDIALRVVAIMAVGFVIYGGFRYVTSRGEPEQTKKAQDTILKAIIGAVIAMVAAIGVSFIVGRLSS